MPVQYAKYIRLECNAPSLASSSWRTQKLNEICRQRAKYMDIENDSVDWPLMVYQAS